MAAAILLIVIIVASLVVIRAGAIALELTGMERDKARFQALSAFTNTGFTTREAEEITHFPARRKIVTVLIVLGYAGTVSVIATFATSLLQRDVLPHLGVTAGILAVLYVLYRIAAWRGLTRPLVGAFRTALMRRYGLQAPSLEHMLAIGEGFGVMRVRVDGGSPLVGKPLQELGLKLNKVQILTIIRGRDTITIPQGEDVLMPGDVLVCYGKTAIMRALFSVEQSTAP